MDAPAIPPVARSDGVSARDLLQYERRYYVIASCVLLFVSFFGFREFLLGGKGAGGMPITPQIVSLVVVHGIAMLGWVVLLVAQSFLIVSGRRRLHMTLGRWGAVMAAVVVLTSFAVAPLSVRFNPELYAAFGGPRYFLAFALAAPIMFGVMTTLGIVYRAQPEVHRPLMLVATTAMTTGSFDRWPGIAYLLEVTHGNVPVVHWGPMLVLGALLLLLHIVMTRRPSRWFVLSYLSVVATTQLAVVVAGSAAWDQIAALAVP